MALGKAFQDKCYYFSKGSDKNYEFLPFRFGRLNSKVLLTNEVGEYLILFPEEFNEFISKNLDQTSHTYSQLKSKHFLIDKDSSVALELLALKVRTKHAVIRNFTSLHIFVVTLRCDYSCPYCQVSRQSEDKEQFDMSLANAEKALEMTFRSPSPNIKIEFQGGESLLNFPLIQEIVYRAEVLNKLMGKNLQFVVATNLSFLNDDIIRFAEKHNFYFSTSLDGPEDIHNANRPRPGKNGYQLTINGIQKIQDYLGPDKVSALMTTTEASLSRVRDIIDEYVERGFKSVFLRPLSPYGFAVKTNAIHKYDAERWLDFYKEGLDYILKLNQQGIPILEQYTSIILSKIFTPYGTGYVDLQSPAGAGISAIVFNYNGEVYATDEARMLAEMGDKTFKLGNLNTNTYEDIFTSPPLLDALETSITESCPMCNDCVFQPYCGSDPVYHHATQGDFIGHKSKSGFCHKNMGIFKHIFTLLEENKEARNIFNNWIYV